MTRQEEPAVDIARNLLRRLASQRLTPSAARLYSQYTRLRVRQPGLPTWRAAEAASRLNDAVRLIGASFLCRSEGSEDWRAGLRRAGELLEWLDHPELRPQGVPLRLLAAAVYQLAGLPARASGLINQDDASDQESQVLASLLAADFQALLRHLARYWVSVAHLPMRSRPAWDDPAGPYDSAREWIVRLTTSCLGILCAEMRWGSEARLDRSLAKLSAISKLILHGHDPYSWLLAKLTAEVSTTQVTSSMRHCVEPLRVSMSREGHIALERYLRQRYQTCRALAWPSQHRGIEQLTSGTSFALFTPTGAGKTTVAELAILQDLFPGPDSPRSGLLEGTGQKPLALYLVPSRALAAEVESKLSRVVRNLGTRPVIVTGLYGGADWGPMDAWLTREDPTVLICTYEKADALIRFLGPMFLSRISLVVIDEAHSVQFEGETETLRTGDSRALRLESLTARLLARLDQSGGRAIALSAAASGIEGALASWAAGRILAEPIKSSYRSTRQLVGRLQCLRGGRFEMRYDVLDGASLHFDNGQGDVPYVPDPFPPCPQPPGPPRTWAGAEKGLRPPLLWAAAHLASPDVRGRRHAVLISVTQGIAGYGRDFLSLLQSPWGQDIPPLFDVPTEPMKKTIWERCLKSCEDYFGSNSYEYQLLTRGIVVHHGRMPGLLSRLCVDLIDERVVHVVLATSTLSEGVNLPFEIVLIPTLRRCAVELSVREFCNLVGRAGRPGSGTEGRSLVLLNPDDRRAVDRYARLVRGLLRQSEGQVPDAGPQSPLGLLISDLWQEWQRLGSTSWNGFLDWLEQVVAPYPPLTAPDDPTAGCLWRSLDSLDGVLLPSLEGAKRMADGDFTPAAVEEELARVWRRSYAHFAVAEESRLADAFVRRGRALVTTILPNATQRRRIICTGLPPSSAMEMIDLYPSLRQHLETGADYADWASRQRLHYIESAVALLGTISKFAPGQKIGRANVDWRDVLRWWLDPRSAAVRPSAGLASEWYKFVRDSFEYRFTWGLGSVLSLATDDVCGDTTGVLPMDEWPRTGLPWIALWLKELVTWGTLEPVAAYALSRRVRFTRVEAEALAAEYRAEQGDVPGSDEVLNPTRIREWLQQRELNLPGQRAEGHVPRPLMVRLLRDFAGQSARQWRVVPAECDGKLYWFDPGGFLLASCSTPIDWRSSHLDDYDFWLDPDKQSVWAKDYANA